MLLKGPHSHISSTTPFTSSRLVIHGVYCKSIAPNTVSCISVTTYFYVYLAGDPTWTMVLGESDLTPTSWLHQQPPTITPQNFSLHRLLRRLLRMTPARAVDYFGTLIAWPQLVGFDISTSWVHQQPSATTWLHEECTATRWWLLRLLVSPTRLVGRWLCLATRWRLLRLLVSLTKLVKIESN
jgi:hypothetical protein